MIIVECDRCHLTNRDISTEAFYEMEITTGTMDDHLDLCPHCYTEFVQRFMSVNSTKEMLPHE